MKLSVVLVLCIGSVSGVKIGAFLDKIRKSLSDVGDIVDGAQDVVKYVRSFPILHAAAIGDEEKIKVELNDKFDINYSSSDGTTALMEAAAHGQYNMIKFLIDNGAKIDQKNKYGFLAYDYAVHSDHEEVLPLLGGRGEFSELIAYSGSNEIFKPKSTQIFLIFALIFGSRRIFQLLL
ncbi:protein phosphatase 1 regulatory subunit 12A-like [Sitodiplosis mosellana]|uniref:protein phosphatase 1 regulatory subunit 12A-like n=1 Tax=Sitodiplosis mosellana TaxID=263140 RepID=UPI002444E0BB|nr:protein phosphatase 1 regulatory subunit 12A-like [Sitodiplosis mosellana]